jgi:pimeloyl-ACP methyl ester carboxylesterase
LLDEEVDSRELAPADVRPSLASTYASHSQMNPFGWVQLASVASTTASEVVSVGTLLAPEVSGLLRGGEIRVDGVRTPLLEGGSPGVDEAVVFVHGNPGSSRDWVDLAGAVSAFARVAALDMPAFGRADRPRTFEYTVEGYARHLARCLDALGIRRAHLVLHDFGGAWGLAWAAGHPDAFRSATLINTGILPGYRWHYLARIWRTPVLGELFMATSTRSGFRLLLRHGNPRGLPPAFVDRMYDDFDTGTRRAVLRLYRATDPRGFAALGPPLRRLHRPALVVWGAHDPYLPVAYASRQREVFPDARVVVLDGSGHWPFADDPAAVAAAVIPFLREQLGTASSPSPPRAGEATGAHEHAPSTDGG